MVGIRMVDINFIKDLAKRAGVFIQQSKQGQSVVMEKIGGGNFVTKADFDSERLILKEIGFKYPGHKILSEESKPNFNPKNCEDLWIIDPLDGTTNFKFGIPCYGVSIAYFHSGKVQDGVIYDIPNQTLFYAVKDKGAFKNNGEKLKIEDKPISGSVVCAGSPYNRENFSKILPNLDKIHAAGGRIEILGSSVISSTNVAQNRFVLYFEIGLKPWDVAASSLIIEEAGGICTNFSGQPIDLFDPVEYTCGSKQALDEYARTRK